MCQFQQLYCDANGYIIRCDDCKHYQLLFNRTVLSLSETEFKKFLQAVGEYKADESSLEDPDVVLPTPSKGVYMILSHNQLSQLFNMMETADAEVRALELLQLFQ